MAYEVKDWKNPDCVISLKTPMLSKRAGHSEEINEAQGESGGLNANYTTVEAVARVANILGQRRLVYGEDFVFRTGGSHSISLNAADPGVKKLVEDAFEELFGAEILDLVPA